MPRFWVSAIRDRNNQTVFMHEVKEEQVLDPRVAFIMVNLMEDVIRGGTAAGVRSRGFAIPAAGKTGTARDGWFAGFTTKLLCVVWVGFDDYRELPLEGSKSALPVWTEFMKRAHALRQYRDAKPFKHPAGIVSAEIDPTTGLLVGDQCPDSRTEIFVAGTQPRDLCEGPHYDQFYDELDIPRESVPVRTRNAIGRFLGGIFR